MPLEKSDTVSRTLDTFAKENPRYAETLERDVLRRYLDQAQAEVLRGEHVAKTEEQLEQESRAAGIDKPDYEALVNLVVHAATDRPIKQ